MKKEEVQRTQEVAEKAERGEVIAAKDEGGRPSQATLLAELASDIELFHTAERDAYASIIVNGHRENVLLKEKDFRHYLTQRFYEEHSKTPHSQAVQSALGVLEGKALFKCPEFPVYTRLAEHNGNIYLDLANEQWEVVEITADRWNVLSDPPVKFRRARGMLPLPRPVKGGNIEELRPFINVEGEEDEKLVVGCLLGAFRPKGPYVILNLNGEQGSAKSTTARVFRALVDPNKSPLRSEPKDERDLMIAATNGWCLVFDNFSYVSNALSDALCRLATGGGFATRELYTDNQEALFEAQRPVIIDGIEELATRPDLLDRSVIVYLPQISDENRIPEKKFWPAFEEARPRILGALLDAVSTALRKLPSTHLAKVPRMADFALWVTASESALGWESGSFLAAYEQNRGGINELALEASTIAPAVRELSRRYGEDGWQGTATDLLAALNLIADETTRKQRSWPKSAKALGGGLRRVAPNLRGVGIRVEFWRESDTGRERMITIKTLSGSAVQDVQNVQSASPRTTSDVSDNENLALPGSGMQQTFSVFPLHGKEHTHEFGIVTDQVGTFQRCKHCGAFPQEEGDQRV